MVSTYIKSEGAMWIAGKKKFASDSFVIFQRVRRTGWEVVETADNTGYKIIFWHGRKFYQDQVKRLRKAKKAGSKQLSVKTKDKKNRQYQIPPDSEEIFDRLQKEFDIAETKAVELVRNFAVEKIKAQVESFAYRREKVQNVSGYIICAIESGYSLPEGYYTEPLKKKEREKAEKARKDAIDVCPLCDIYGQRNVKCEEDVSYGCLLHDCTHDADFEKQFEEFEFEDYLQLKFS